MVATASTPTSTASFGNVSRTGDERELMAREIEACSKFIVELGSTAATAGAQNIGYPDAGGYTAQTNVAGAVNELFAQKGIIPASASTPITLTGGTNTIKVASGCLRTISAVGIATGCTVAISATGAVQGMRFRICKTATGGTGAVVIDGHSFTTHKKFNCELAYVSSAWRLMNYFEYA